jgi:hypothetical protein
VATAGVDDTRPKSLAYADPPYPGLASRYYRYEPEFRGEVDHEQLVRELIGFDGWALSTSSEALRDVLSLCPRGTLVAAWVKPANVANCKSRHKLWEPVLYRPARALGPGIHDALLAAPARGGDSSLIGRKPIAFVTWLFTLLGANPEIDTLTDLFPGSGVVVRVWRELSRGAASHPFNQTSEAPLG